MPDEPPRLRQWKLMSLLSARRYGLTIRELAREMDVGEKTIRRDLDLFRRVGMPLEATSGERGRKTWRIAGERGQPPLTFHCRGAGNCTRVQVSSSNSGTCTYGNGLCPWSEMGREDAALWELVARWHHLSSGVRDALLVLVRSTRV